MKKFFVSLLAVSLMLLFFSYAKAGPSIDQQYTAGGGSVSIDSSLGRFAQTFKPTFSKLDRVELELANIVGSKTLSVSIRHRNGLTWDEGYMTTVSNQTISNGWNTFDFADQTLVLSDTDTYGIWINCPENGPQWKYTSGPSTYDRGFAIWQSNDKFDWDYNFKTWGYEPTEIVGENTQPTDTQTENSASSETLGTVSTSIAKPLNLTAAYSQADGGVKVSWKASTTVDIDGYKVFHSESQSSGYTKISETTKAKLDAIDSNIAAGKTYYYQVRAYKGSDQSVSSNTASVKIPDSVPPAKPIKLEVVDKTDSMLKVTWRKTEDATVTGYTINLYKGGEKVRTAELEAKDELYSFFDLDSATVYKVELIAKNAKDQTSSPAITYGYTQFPEEFENLIDTVRALAAVLVLILLLILAIRTKKHYLNK